MFADWLDEQGDPRAEGYRALGVLRRVPVFDPCNPERESGGTPDKPEWGYVWCYVDMTHAEARARFFNYPGSHILGAAIPGDWCAALLLDAEDRASWNIDAGWYGYWRSRREAEDAAAIAFSKLPADRRAELLAATPEGASK